MKNHFVFSKDPANKKFFVERGFDAPLAQVWAAWTESNLLDQWWAPKPWKTATKTMDFTLGGLWLYAMVSPQGDEHFCRVDFKAMSMLHSFSYVSAFCDKDGVINHDSPQMSWSLTFIESAGATQVNIQIYFEKETDFHQIVAMGFEGGFTMGLGNLDELLLQLKSTQA